ncbi:hypothetical protein CC78DRAFT_579011 [Lojkania enalia]|uniref:Uncharacterized protein n=1 Tax=Lojkania enalia TaxID=147567 RepID=A0A9P4KAS6_9PLEO|nr:hypothetical protein CC78DRAFT_579011 [Didymosphaeria enalia]
MNNLVFAAHDVTPELWDDFVRAAAFPEQKPGEKPIAPYILVHSLSHSDFRSETERIDATVKTDWASATWKELKDAFLTLAEPNSTTVHTNSFILLDKQSPRDRKAIMIEKTREWILPGGEKYWPLPYDTRDDLRKVTIWKRHRVPFEKVWEVSSAMLAFGAEIEMYIEDVTKEVDEEIGP